MPVLKDLNMSAFRRPLLKMLGNDDRAVMRIVVTYEPADKTNQDVRGGLRALDASAAIRRSKERDRRCENERRRSDDTGSGQTRQAELLSNQMSDGAEEVRVNLFFRVPQRGTPNPLTSKAFGVSEPREIVYTRLSRGRGHEVAVPERLYFAPPETNAFPKSM